MTDASEYGDKAGSVVLVSSASLFFLLFWVSTEKKHGLVSVLHRIAKTFSKDATCIELCILSPNLGILSLRIINLSKFETL